MNYRVIILVLMLIFQSFGFCQNFTDANSHAINQYFELKINSDIPNYLNIKNWCDNPVSFEIVQNGNQNFSTVNPKTNDTFRIVQMGNANQFEQFAFYNSSPNQIDIAQLGQNNSLFLYGKNEISNQMRIIQNTNNQTLIIKNY